MKYFIFVFFLFISSFVFAQQQTIESITFENVKKMDADFLNDIVTSKVTEPIDSLKIFNDVTFLKRLNGITHVTYTIDYTENNTAILRFNVQENRTLIPNISLWSTEDVTAFKLGLYDYNFLGKNGTIGGYYQYNYFHSGGISFTAPFLFSKKWGLETHVQKRSSKEPVFFNNTSANYEYSNTSFEVLGTYQINFNNRFKFGASVFNEKYNFLDGSTSPEIPLNYNIDKSLVKLEYYFDNVQFEFYLLKGIKNNLYLQYVKPISASTRSFMVGWNDFLVYRRTGKNGNWASRIRLGLSSNDKSPFSPFSVDNNVNIRGTGNIIDRGTGVIVINTEYRKTLFEKKWFVLQGNVFVDSGTWRNPGGGFSNFYDSKNIRIYPGAGLRFMHKKIFNAIFRIDYGYGITPNSSHGMVFGIGQYF